MLKIFNFISGQKIKTIVLVCTFIIPYIFWIIWFTDKNINKLVSWIISVLNQNKREIKIITEKIKHIILTVYINIYLGFVIPFVIFCIKWDYFNKYLSEILNVAGLISIPYIIYILLQIKIIFANILDGCLRNINVFADTLKRSTRNVLVYGMTLLFMPLMGFFSVILIILIPLIIASTYVEWIKKLVRLIKNKKRKNENKPLVLYKYRDIKNWEKYSGDYLDGKLFFADRRSLNDPAECISMINRTSSRIDEERSHAKRTDGDYDPLEKYRICSMTGEPGNFVMWANYASNNTGVCIEYLIDSELLEKEGIKCEKVFYTKFLPAVEDFVYPYDFFKKDFQWKDIRKFIFHKLEDWKYEDEWRLVKEFDAPKESDKPENLYNLRIGTVTKIICGYKCSLDFIEQLKEKSIPVEQVTFEISDKKGVYLCVPISSDEVYGEFKNDEWKYKIDDDDVIILSYIGGKKEINIPAIIRGKQVSTIGEEAFKNRSDLTSVNIPAGVTKIEPSAFYGCSGLITASIGKDVKTIGKNAFAFCSDLTSVNFNGVSVIGKGAFRNCSALTSVTLPDGVSVIEKGAFQNCTALTSVRLPEGVSAIKKGAFRNCISLTSINLPSSVYSVGDEPLEKFIDTIM